MFYLQRPRWLFAVKWFGVAYLLYLAYLQWTAPVKDIEIQHEKKDKSVSALLLNGFVVNISNPKAIVFLLAVLPQFLDLSKPQWIQYLIMAATMVTIDLIVMAGYTGLASKVLRLLRSPKQQKYLNRGFAVMFSCAALLLSTVHQAA